MINYKHLHYFWIVAKQGGVTRASEFLHLTPQTISGQLSILEDQVGKVLFNKVGRKLELTDAGRMVLGYADEIFSLGNELEESLRQQTVDRPLVFKVGIADVVPKSIVHRLLEPVLELPEQVRLVCRENNMENLLAELALHRIDMVIADTPIPETINVSGYSHSLGDCGICFMAVPSLAKSLKSKFPECLNGAPMLVPSDNYMIRSRLMGWFDRMRIYPRIVGEFDDSALMNTFGQEGVGVFIVPTAIADEVARQIKVKKIGTIDEVREQFFAISVERRISHPAVAAITKRAREWLS
jgi:LysR family transcriptional activator of nhaA